MFLRTDKHLKGPRPFKGGRGHYWDDHYMRLVCPSWSLIGRAIWTSSGIGFFVTPSVNIPNPHRDPSVWVDPTDFRSERFLTTHKDVDVKMPFGSGKRICLGFHLLYKLHNSY